MTLSIIIVNYNVKYFLEQCLYSVKKAIAGMESEVIVVDNLSTDGSINYLSPKFPEVNFVTSTTNLGFAKACNKGVEVASGKFILFLNPDTIVAEDTFSKCIAFFEAHTDCGALGVKMVDGSGKFLKESKRSFPGPLTSLFKLFGLGRLFPKSKFFNRYHLGHLDKNKIHEVDVLAGAYFMARKDVLDKTGSFDEKFFMYGEDVDLSYRIQQAGFKNYYFPDTTIIHFKGESTRRGSLNYVRLFYNAMSIFVRKHYGGTKASLFNFCIHIAIWFRAFIAAFAKFIKWIGLPAIDAALILFSFWITKEFWIAFIRRDIIFPEKLLVVAFPLFTLVYMTAAFFAGLYDRYYKTTNLIRSTFIATVTLLVLYALLPEKFRFSRGIVFFGALLALVLIAFQRWLLVTSGLLQQPPSKISKPHILIAASSDEYNDVTNLLTHSTLNEKVIGRVATNGDSNESVATVDSINDAAVALDAREVIFCAGTFSFKNIIEQIQRVTPSLRMRFHTAGSSSIVGSDASTSSGEILSAEAEFKITKASNQRLKKLIDISASILFLLTFPLHLLFVRKPLRFFKNCFAVIWGNKTWVGYLISDAKLPYLPESVLASNGKKNTQSSISLESLHLLDYWYARNYDPLQDVKTIFRNYRHLGA